MVMAFADITTGYLLEIFYAIDLPGETEIAYDDNSAFNDYLDSLYPLEGKPLYSRALHEQYREDYLIQLDDYRDELGATDE